MKRPLISICIANYNGMAVIDECIRSVEQQTIDQAVEIIVHDDASSDGSAAHIQANYPNVRLMQGSENVGFCIANNRMAEVAQGEYLLLLNNDAALFPDALATLMRVAREMAQPAILSLPQYDFETGVLIDRGCLLDPFLNPVPNLDPHRREVGMVIGACLWIPKTLWDELGGFPEWFGSIGEDLYLCCRARLAGYMVVVPSASGYSHRVGQSFGGGKTQQGRLSTTLRRRVLSERNKTFVMTLTYPAPFMQMLLPIHLVLLLIEGALLSILRGRLALLTEIYLPVLSALFGQYDLLLAKRRTIMKNRHSSCADFFAVFVPLPHKPRMLWRYGLPDVV